MFFNAYSRSALVLAIQFWATTAFGICIADANISAAPLTDPGSAGWRYTLTIEWSYADYGMLSWSVFLDGPDSECDCNTLETELSIPDLAGNSTGNLDGCSVPYSGLLECGPAAPFPGWTTLTFYPDPDVTCAMPSGGVTVLSFDSIFPPQPVAADAQIALAGACGIQVTGVLPVFACDPVGVEEMSWGSIKAIYR
jgi:hypothetical protein